MEYLEEEFEDEEEQLEPPEQRIARLFDEYTVERNDPRRNVIFTNESITRMRVPIMRTFEYYRQNPHR